MEKKETLKVDILKVMRRLPMFSEVSEFDSEVVGISKRFQIDRIAVEATNWYRFDMHQMLYKHRHEHRLPKSTKRGLEEIRRTKMGSFWDCLDMPPQIHNTKEHAVYEKQIMLLGDKIDKLCNLLEKEKEGHSSPK